MIAATGGAAPLTFEDGSPIELVLLAVGVFLTLALFTAFVIMMIRAKRKEQ